MVVGTGNRDIKPGYFMSGGDEHSTTGDPLATVVWNESINMKMVGAYNSSNLVQGSFPDVEYTEGSNLSRDSKNKTWSLDDLKKRKSSMNKIRIAARGAAYMYSDGIPYDIPEINKNLEEIYREHSSGRHKIDLTKIATAGAPDPTNPDALRK